MSEEELVKRLREKDLKGFRYLMQYYPMCRKMMRNYNLDEDSSKDIFQESLIVLYENLQKESFELTAKVSSYLYSVCQNKVRAHSRKKSKVETITISEEPDTIKQVKHGQDDSNLILYKELENELPEYDEIYNAIVNLGHTCRELLSMFYYHRFRMKEIMEEQGYTNENATRQAKKRCLDRLKKYFLG
ncbi:sigma-70 family RNA polymerase sigma factor [Catalinimonas sp. 4WD22]|uniref:RNA polymerase sigma factor n=1 Tax=Catalinimonas locisalis TaxID=3133978 RepID=UPI00310139FB